LKAEIVKNRQLETTYFSSQLSPFQLFFILLLPFRTLPPVVEAGAWPVD
jgi:hypothetical protein